MSIQQKYKRVFGESENTCTSLINTSKTFLNYIKFLDVLKVKIFQLFSYFLNINFF